MSTGDKKLTVALKVAAFGDSQLAAARALKEAHGFRLGACSASPDNAKRLLAAAERLERAAAELVP